MPEANNFDVGDEVFVIDDVFDPVVQRGVVVRNLDRYPESVEVDLGEEERASRGCVPYQIIHVDAGPDEVDEFLRVGDR